ncbi:MAG: hypothetical protein AAFY91_14780, partial [Bacteroidota bacterium]
MSATPQQLDTVLAENAALIAEVKANAVQLQKATAALNEVAQLLAAQAKRSPFMTAREAADYLGLDTTKKNYPRRLSWLSRNHGLKFKAGKPRMYVRTSVEELALKIANQKIGF